MIIRAVGLVVCVVENESIPEIPVSIIRNIRLVLEHNASWSRARFAKLLKSLEAKLSIFGSFRLSVAWKLGGRHLTRIVAAFRDEMSANAEEYCIFRQSLHVLACCLGRRHFWQP